jgi:hypothetical protein
MGLHVNFSEGPDACVFTLKMEAKYLTSLLGVIIQKKGRM